MLRGSKLSAAFDLLHSAGGWVGVEEVLLADEKVHRKA